MAKGFRDTNKNILNYRCWMPTSIEFRRDKSFRKGVGQMSQIVVVRSSHGIILASEDRAIQLNERGEEISIEVKRLLPLSPQSALLIAGAPEGIYMAKSLKNFVQGEGLKDVQDLYGAALAYLSTEYERFMRKKCEILPVDPIHYVSFILAGKTSRDEERPFRLYYLWTKKKLPQLDGEEISNAFSLPRRMALEYQLNQLSKSDASLDDILGAVKGGVEKLSAQEETKAPFSWAKITQDGFQALKI
jgi:hypothetical protein